MNRGSFLGIVLGLLGGEKEATPMNNVLSVAAGNMLADDLHELADKPLSGKISGDYYISKTSTRKGIELGTIVKASLKDLSFDTIGEYVGVDGQNEKRVIIKIDDEYHSVAELLVERL